MRMKNEDERKIEALDEQIVTATRKFKHASRGLIEALASRDAAEVDTATKEYSRRYDDLFSLSCIDMSIDMNEMFEEGCDKAI